MHTPCHGCKNEIAQIQFREIPILIDFFKVMRFFVCVQIKHSCNLFFCRSHTEMHLNTTSVLQEISQLMFLLALHEQNSFLHKEEAVIEINVCLRNVHTVICFIVISLLVCIKVCSFYSLRKLVFKQLCLSACLSL